MAAVKELKEIKKETQENIVDVLTKDECDYNVKLQAVQNLKILFRPPDKILSKLKLDSLLQGARVSLESKSEKSNKNFLYHYGASLIGFFGRDETLNAELLYQLEYILEKLKEEDENLARTLVTDIWNRFEITSFFQPNGILDASKETLERIVLDWVDSSHNLRLDFLSKMSAHSPKLFQTLTSILYVILVRTQGLEKVFELSESFIISVKRVCQKEEKNFLGLYPKGCSRLVSLLMVPPEVYSQESEDIFKEVLSLLLEVFMANRNTALILLSHYSKWTSVFKGYVSGLNGGPIEHHKWKESARKKIDK